MKFYPSFFSLHTLAFIIILTGLTGLEPATSAVTGRCSNQLNYSPLCSPIYYIYRFGWACQPFSKIKFLDKLSTLMPLPSVRKEHRGMRRSHCVLLCASACLQTSLCCWLNLRQPISKLVMSLQPSN